MTDGYWYFPMVCFCDIALTRLTEHTSYYGSYGIGMSKEWGERNGVSPVFYLNTEAPVAHCFHNSAGRIAKTSIKSQNTFMQVIAFTKPLRGVVKRGGKLKAKDFYEECEWRYVPDFSKKNVGIASEKTFKKIGFKMNEEMREYSLKFTPDDISYILVNRDEDIPLIYDFLNQRMGDYSLNSIKKLTSCIISLPRLIRDT